MSKKTIVLWNINDYLDKEIKVEVQSLLQSVVEILTSFLHVKAHVSLCSLALEAPPQQESAERPETCHVDYDSELFPIGWGAKASVVAY